MDSNLFAVPPRPIARHTVRTLRNVEDITPTFRDNLRLALRSALSVVRQRHRPLA